MPQSHRDHFLRSILLSLVWISLVSILSEAFPIHQHLLSVPASITLVTPRLKCKLAHHFTTGSGGNSNSLTSLAAIGRSRSSSGTSFVSGDYNDRFRRNNSGGSSTRGHSGSSSRSRGGSGGGRSSSGGNTYRNTLGALRFDKKITIDPSVRVSIDQLNISTTSRDVLFKRGFEVFTPVQSHAYEYVYGGSDVVARSRTGTGKTLAFGLPLIERLIENSQQQQQQQQQRGRRQSPQVLILEPTRELALQVAEELAPLCNPHNLKVSAVYGGASFNTQEEVFRTGLHVLVGTPGRVLDHITRGTVDLSAVKYVVLDEGDTMLEMGFQQAVEGILSNVKNPSAASVKAAFAALNRDMPAEPVGRRRSISSSSSSGVGSSSDGDGRDNGRGDSDSDSDGDINSKRSNSNVQTLLFSATMPGWICDLTDKHMINPVFLDAVQQGENRLAGSIKHIALKMSRESGGRSSAVTAVIGDVILTYGGGGQTIVFTKTREEANALVTSKCFGKLSVQAIHGDISQATRQHVLQQFKQGHTDVLVATDVAARGLDIAGVDLVVHTCAPQDTDSFVHRAGRTGRAGRGGTSVLLHSAGESFLLGKLEHALNFEFTRIGPPKASEVQRSAVEAALKKIGSVGIESYGEYLPYADQFLASAIATAAVGTSDGSSPSNSNSARTDRKEVEGTFTVADVLSVEVAAAAAASPLGNSATSSSLESISSCSSSSSSSLMQNSRRAMRILGARLLALVVGRPPTIHKSLLHPDASHVTTVLVNMHITQAEHARLGQHEAGRKEFWEKVLQTKLLDHHHQQQEQQQGLDGVGAGQHGTAEESTSLSLSTSTSALSAITALIGEQRVMDAISKGEEEEEARAEGTGGGKDDKAGGSASSSLSSCTVKQLKECLSLLEPYSSGSNDNNNNNKPKGLSGVVKSELISRVQVALRALSAEKSARDPKLKKNSQQQKQHQQQEEEEEVEVGNVSHTVLPNSGIFIKVHRVVLNHNTGKETSNSNGNKETMRLLQAAVDLNSAAAFELISLCSPPLVVDSSSVLNAERDSSRSNSIAAGGGEGGVTVRLLETLPRWAAAHAVGLGAGAVGGGGGGGAVGGGGGGSSQQRRSGNRYSDKYSGDEEKYSGRRGGGTGRERGGYRSGGGNSRAGSGGRNTNNYYSSGRRDTMPRNRQRGGSFEGYTR